MLDPLPQPERPPRRRASPRTRRAPRGWRGRRSRARRRANPRRAPARTISASSSPARDLDAGAVEHPRRLRAERPVHEDLQVADPEEVVAEPRAEAELLEPPEVVVRERLPDAQRERALRRRGAARSAVRPSQPSLSWTAVTPRAAATFSPSRIASTNSSSAALEVPVAEPPGRLLAQHARSARRARRARRRRPATSSSPSATRRAPPS